MVQRTEQMKRGDIYTVSIPCASCGSVAVLNIWYEKERDGSYKRYGMIYVNKQNDGSGDYSRIRKDSFEWYKKVIRTNGEDLG